MWKEGCKTLIVWTCNQGYEHQHSLVYFLFWKKIHFELSVSRHKLTSLYMLTLTTKNVILLLFLTIPLVKRRKCSWNGCWLVDEKKGCRRMAEWPTFSVRWLRPLFLIRESLSFYWMQKHVRQIECNPFMLESDKEKETWWWIKRSYLVCRVLSLLQIN